MGRSHRGTLDSTVPSGLFFFQFALMDEPLPLQSPAMGFV